jgi:hypothetical protein
VCRRGRGVEMREGGEEEKEEYHFKGVQGKEGWER